MAIDAVQDRPTRPATTPAPRVVTRAAPLASETAGRASSTVPRKPGWTITAYALAALYLAPLVAVVAAATGDSAGLWGHLAETVLPRYVSNTLTLMAGVGVVTLVFGVASAWIVTRYTFTGSRALSWLLLLPAAVPAYIIAYAYTDFFEYAGPVQGALRSTFGFESARDYWFPEIRSMGGAMLVMGAVLYPYVYMMSRAAFVLTPASLFETAMVSKRNLFWSVALPLARPAIIAGLALVLMETISDFGTVEFFAIETLTLGIFNVWLGQNNLAAAAQIAIIAFLFIAVLLWIERRARSNRQFLNTTKRSARLAPRPLRGWRAAVGIGVCLVPIIVGFVVPVGVLLGFVLGGTSLSFTPAMTTATINSLLLSGTVAVVVMAAALFFAVIATYLGNRALHFTATATAFGYAFPGTILAIGVVTAAGFIDRQVGAASSTFFGVTTSGLISSGFALVVIACVVRFHAVGYGAMTSGIGRLPRNMMNASRQLGRGFSESLRFVIVPLLGKSLIAGGLLVFVDVMKELPMTLLLRPFNFETLPTFVYQYAKDELLEEAALPALLIVFAGIIPILIMNAALERLAAAKPASSGARRET
ncbi:MAG: iron ABC transporter permease [Pseudomonadota bacterium]